MADLGDPLAKVIDRQGNSKWRWITLRQKLVKERGMDAKLVDQNYATNSEKLAEQFWARGEAWTISAAWWGWALEMHTWNFAHHHIKAGPGAPAYDKEDPTKYAFPRSYIPAHHVASHYPVREAVSPKLDPSPFTPIFASHTAAKKKQIKEVVLEEIRQKKAQILAGMEADKQKKAEQDKTLKDNTEKDKTDKERSDKEKAKKENAEKRKAKKERAEKERADKEKAEKEKAELKKATRK
ncbi:hypothetical protein PG985_010406 [Apiospora marii]|uniref:uncharacterized protein n=1 Tax=Apiospora marii TaxID=335849 RepID=UPI00312FEFF2